MLGTQELFSYPNNSIENPHNVDNFLQTSTQEKSNSLKFNLRKVKINDKLMKNWKITQLSRDHKPELEDEKKRIEGTGYGSVQKVEDERGIRYGPFRVFDQYGVSGGLAMSRSIGDHALDKAGVIADPEFIEHNINENDKVIIIASDGLWEYLSNEGKPH